jgi:hypothetical protein
MSRRGKEFHLCAKSKTDLTFAKYPTLPVTQCRGFVNEKEPSALNKNKE